VKKELIEKSGAWYSLNGERMGQGRDQAKTFLRENPALMEELRGKILTVYGIGKKGEAQKAEAVAGLVEKNAAAAAAKPAEKHAEKVHDKVHDKKPSRK
jgi:recombination protein RecA